MTKALKLRVSVCSADRAPAPLLSGVLEESSVAQPILLVDDDPTVLQLVSTILKRQGHEVFEASSGAAALQIAKDHPQIDLVLSDVVMPEMSGVQLCEALKVLRPQVRCILMSGNDLGLLASEKGAYFLAKPFFPNELLRKVNEVLSLHTC